MTQIYFDDREIELPIDCSSISRILKYVDEAHLAENSVVRKIQVNGHPFMPNGFSETGGHAAPHAFENSDKIEIFTGNTAEIASGSISEALGCLELIESLTPSLIRDCQIYPSPDSLGNLRQLYEGFCWMDLLFKKLESDFPVCSDDTRIQNSFDLECRRKFIAALKRSKESLENGALVWVSDVLERDILPLVPLWREMLMTMAQRAGGMQIAVKSPSNLRVECQTPGSATEIASAFIYAG
jgi:hypothetical protein